MQDRRGYDNRKGALKARTPSQINSSSPRSESSAVKSSRSENKRVHHKFDESVRNPNAPAPLGTVQQRASPTRVANGQATPEWKRRLVNGKGNAKEATDLLSPKPVGLEGVFKPPTIKRQQVQKDVGKRRPLLGEKNQPNGKANQGSSSSQPEKVSPKQVACYDDPCEQDRRLGKPAEGVDTQRHTSLGIQDASIMASDQSQSDGFSPAVLSKQVTANGQIHFTATPSPKKRPSIDGGKTQWSPTHPPPFPCEGLEAQHPVQTSALDQSTANQDMPIITSQSLPDDLSVGTDEFAARGGYVSLKRGGYSEEGSFQSMPLSSSAGNFDGPSLRGRSAPLPDERSFPAENALQDDSLVSPRTPELGYAVVQSSPERPRSSGSPLKLFDKYDTFTNDRLLRRMSKFEETMAQGEQSVLDADNSSKLSTPPPGPKRGAQVDLSHGEPNADSSRVSSFGDGALDNYIFPDPPAQEPRLPQLPRMTSQYTSTETPRKRQQSKTRPRRFSQSNHVQHSTRNHSEAVHEPPDDSTTRQGANSIPKQGSEAYQTAHGKRLRGSPAKGSSPKRRRTLQNPENSLQIDVAAQVTVSESQSTPSKSLVGRKRKDARYEQGEKLANPEILAMRQMRRPRNPTPSQASSSTRQSPSIYIDETPQSTPKKANSQSDAEIEAPVQFLADVLATNALNTAQHMASSRKPSVTTADYFNEAQQIMSLIRAEKRPHSSHETMNQSRIGQQTIYEESWLAESTMEQFSRPPSRDGSVPSRTRDLPSVDVRAVSQLQRFEDKDDLGLALSTSVKTLKLNRSRSQSDAFVVHKAFVEDSHGESDPPNVRIRARTEGVHQLPQAGHRRNDSEKSNDSKRSIPTRSSGSSTNRMVIAPENVAHLLSDRMAGMMFDRQRQMWVKSKTQEAAPKDCQADREEDSEENILGDIPDLSVNEMEELQRVRDAVSAGQTFRSLHVDVDTNDHATGQQPDNAVYPKERDSDFRPRTADGKSIPPMEDSSAPSKYSHFASSGPVPSTRATSWGDEVWSAKTLPAQAPGLPPVAEVADHASVEEVEREISILEGRVAEPLNHVHQPPRKTRVVTVSFSSPPVDRMHSPDIRETWQNKAHDCETETPSRQDLISPNQSTFRQTDRKPSRRSLSRRMSLDIQARSMSRVDEDEEMSVVQYSVTANRTLDIAISTPLPIARSLGPPSSISRSSIGFQLSPLPDFTINQIDRPLDAEAGVLAKLPDSQAMSTPSSRISLTAQDLIKHLTDLEPYEPYWEYIQMMDLKNRGLSSLHMLDDLCNHVAHLDVSNNHLRELNGLPASVRLLKIQDNCLSDLSAWHHLQNLQYLDVSGNDLTSLKGLWGLHHLRALRADDDGLESLAGIEGLDGLLSLSVQGNRLSKVDFEDFDLYASNPICLSGLMCHRARLVDLDMSNNSISEILNIHRLPNLKSLDIGMHPTAMITSIFKVQADLPSRQRPSDLCSILDSPLYRRSKSLLQQSLNPRYPILPISSLS